MALEAERHRQFSRRGAAASEHRLDNTRVLESPAEGRSSAHSCRNPKKVRITLLTFLFNRNIFGTVPISYGATVTLPNVVPTRKQRLLAALELAGLSLERWCEMHGVSRTHVYFVFEGSRTPGADLNAAIDATIAKYLGPSHVEAA